MSELSTPADTPTQPTAPSTNPPPSLPGFPPHPLAGMPAIGFRQLPPRPQQERKDERCWTFTSQYNVRRALGVEPRSTMYCLMNFRRAISELTPVPGHPGAFLAQSAEPPSPPAPIPPPPGVEVDLPAYHWPRLDGRYIYVARGREQIARHLMETGVGAEEIQKRVERDQEERDKVTIKMDLIQAKQYVEEKGFERIVDLSELWSSSFQRLHLHVIRIYSPLFRNLARLPETFRDGTQERMLETVYGKLTDGSALRLLERMAESSQRMAEFLKERRENGRDGGGNGPALPPPPGGLGGAGSGGAAM